MKMKIAGNISAFANFINRLNHIRQRWCDNLYFEYKLRRTCPILLYQMGKVGSSSIYNSLKEEYPGVVLTSHWYPSEKKDYKLSRLFNRVVKKKKPLKVISLIREPVGRNVSAFFQNFERDTGVSYSDSEFSVRELREIFLENYNHEIPLIWFDENILANFGIDVFATPFPETGIMTYSHENIQLLILRSEVADEFKIQAISAFLNLDHFVLKNINISSEKEYAQTYQAFCDQVKLPKPYLDKMCHSKYFTYFYSSETIESTYQKWINDD
jgi:hypothetical protein